MTHSVETRGLAELVPVWAHPLAAEVLALIVVERARQEQRKTDGRFLYTCADPSPDAMTDAEKLTVLTEEVGEVAREVLTADVRRLARDSVGTREAMLAEVVQVAAVAVAWAEALIAAEHVGATP